MLNQHYLKNMFPINPPAPNDWDDEIPFLDRVVEVDSATVTKPDVTCRWTIENPQKRQPTSRCLVNFDLLELQLQVVG